MNYIEAINWIHNTNKFGMKLGLDNIENLLSRMGKPQNHLKFIHVAGTNGKGSTCSFLNSILMESGYKTGLFISPYIQKFNERIQIEGKYVNDKDLVNAIQKVKQCIDVMVREGYTHPTEFEIVTACALYLFNMKKCDIVILETGLGGRFDSTNVVQNKEATIITSISYDHVDYLGDTISKIAFEKAGIIKEGNNVILAPQIFDEVYTVIEEKCIETNSSIQKVNKSLIQSINYDISGQIFNYIAYKNIKINLLGKHQLDNAITALETIKTLVNKGYSISREAIYKGFQKAKWPGRIEILKMNPYFIVDGAHNKAGAKALKLTLKELFPEKKIIFIFGIFRNKEYNQVIQILSEIAHSFITVSVNNDRAIPAKELVEILKPYCNYVCKSDTIKEAINKSIEIAGDDSIICASGSLYLVGEIRTFINKLKLIN